MISAQETQFILCVLYVLFAPIKIPLRSIRLMYSVQACSIAKPSYTVCIHTNTLGVSYA